MGQRLGGTKPQEEGVMAFVRKCEKCGNVDARQQWSSTTEAADKGAFTEAWTCQTCAWPEFDLVEASEAEAASSRR